jgi:hypothetical protein
VAPLGFVRGLFVVEADRDEQKGNQTHDRNGDSVFTNRFFVTICHDSFLFRRERLIAEGRRHHKRGQCYSDFNDVKPDHFVTALACQRKLRGLNSTIVTPSTRKVGLVTSSRPRRLLPSRPPRRHDRRRGPLAQLRFSLSAAPTARALFIRKIFIRKSGTIRPRFVPGGSPMLRPQDIVLQS